VHNYARAYEADARNHTGRLANAKDKGKVDPDDDEIQGSEGPVSNRNRRCKKHRHLLVDCRTQRVSVAAPA